MGYGGRALELLKQYYELKIPNIDEKTEDVQSEISQVQDQEVSLLEETIGKCSEQQMELHIQISCVIYSLNHSFHRTSQFATAVIVETERKNARASGLHRCVVWFNGAAS